MVLNEVLVFLQIVCDLPHPSHLTITICRTDLSVGGCLIKEILDLKILQCIFLMLAFGTSSRKITKSEEQLIEIYITRGVI